jgi:hypothetical protein
MVLMARNAHSFRAIGGTSHCAGLTAMLFSQSSVTAKGGTVHGTDSAVNYRLAPPEITYVLQDSGAKLVITRPEFAPVLTGLGYDDHVIVVGREYEEIVGSTAPADAPRDACPDECFVQLYTSGTTGFPKGAMLTHRNLATHSEAAATRLNFTHDSVNLVPMPMYHVGGLAWTLLSLHRGAPLIIISDVVPAELVAIAAKFRVTHAFVVPTVLAGLVELPDLAAWDLSSLEGLAYGGAPIPLPLLRRLLQATDAGICQVYGATELSGVVTVLDAADHRDLLDERHLRSAGRPLDGLEVAIVDPETGHRNPPGEVGEVHVRGDQVMAGYWRAPEATAAAVAPGGWFRTGDAGYLDDRGYLFVVDRVKDLIITDAGSSRTTFSGGTFADDPVVECAEEVGERVIRTGAVGSGIEVHEETANDREDEGGELRPIDTAQAFFERPEPVGRRHPAKVGQQLLRRAFPQLPEHPQIGLPFGTGDESPGAHQREGVGLVGSHAQQVAEGSELALPRVPEDGAQQAVAGAEVVDQHAGRGAGGAGQRLEPVGQAVLERVVGARVEQPVLDLGLRSPSHRCTFSRNAEYVYR